jgi:hypothetical protein
MNFDGGPHPEPPKTFGDMRPKEKLTAFHKLESATRACGELA